MSKQVSLVLFEAIVVGIILLVTAYAIRYAFVAAGIDAHQNAIIFISGFLFHVVFEYTGINLWYSIKYCELVKN